LSFTLDRNCSDDRSTSRARNWCQTRSLLGIAAAVVLTLLVSVVVAIVRSSSSETADEPNPSSLPAPSKPSKCTVQPYSVGSNSNVINVSPAIALTNWDECELSIGLDLTHARPFLKEHACRRFSVPIDYSLGIGGGSLNLTIARARKRGSGQMWVLQGGPGSPSHHLLDYMRIDGLTNYIMDHRGTGWSTVLDCPRKRTNLTGSLSWGNSWMRWLGLGNVSRRLLSECLEEVAETIAAPKHFTAANAARDLAAVIMALQKEDGKGTVSMHGLSYGTVWARRFLALQGVEFPILVTRVGLDGVYSADYDFGQHSLATEFAGRALLRYYCDTTCRSKLGMNEDTDANEWLAHAILEIEEAVVDSPMDAQSACGAYLWARFAKDAQSAGWTAKASIKEALGVFGYVAATKGHKVMVEFVAAVHRLHQCLRNVSSTASVSGLPRDFEGVSFLVDKFATSAEEYFYVAPPSFSAILHHVVLFGDMWTGPPELSAWGGPLSGPGDCTIDSWREFFDANVFWSPDFVSLATRYQEIFDKFGYRETSELVQSYGRADENISVFLSNGDLDPQTPRQSARTAYEAFPYCKVYEELQSGTHCISSDYRVKPGYEVFFDGMKSNLPGTNSPCSTGSIEPSSNGISFVLDEFTSRNNAQTVDYPVAWQSSAWYVAPCDPGRSTSNQLTCTSNVLQGCERGCYSSCTKYLQTIGDSMAGCRCAARAMECAKLGGCEQDGIELCQNLTRGSDCVVSKWCGNAFLK